MINTYEKLKHGKRKQITYHAMTMELLGNNLYNLKEENKNKFTLKTVLMLAD
jgi:hypothetical protein